MLLSDIQKHFTEEIISGADQGSRNHNEPFNAIFKTGDIPFNKRIGVYQNNLVQSLSKVIRQSFPLVEKLTGEEFSRQMATLFVRSHTPADGHINHYGEEYPEFIENFVPAQTLPYLPDIARLEWAINEAAYAKDDNALDPAALSSELSQRNHDTAELSWLCLRDNVQLMSSDYPLLAIKEFCENDGTTSAPDMNTTKPSYILVHRPDLYVQCVSIDQDLFEFLRITTNQNTASNELETFLAERTNRSIADILLELFQRKILREK